ncbi:MAG: hypothetical protein FWG67_01995 [Defluviitaleaceae bacterium]|nr:hypothetical protein [Defluviitaleaceae bacterium]
MKEHWQERLLKIEDLTERRLLRGVLLAAFENIETYTDQQLAAIKQRVFDESKPDHDQFNIYTSVVSIDDYDPINDFLFPMDESDLKELPFDATVITEMAQAGEKPILGKLYFELDHLMLKEIHHSLQGRTFKGHLQTNRDDYPIEVSLTPFTGYQQQIERLYGLYLENNIPWRTVLHPSIHKFIEIRLETTLEFRKQEKIEAITLQLEELETHQQINHIPLWNIKTKPFTNQGFPMPAGDRINYEHVLMFEEDIRKQGYLIDSASEADGVINTRLEADRLILISSKDLISKWKLWIIVNPLETDLTLPHLTSNRKIESFIDHFASRTSRVIRTLGEIHRLANLFTDVTTLTLIDMKITAHHHVKSETYPLNPFIKDDIRKDDAKSIMHLTFQTDTLTPYTRDYMSFLTSEINLYFPEYHCVGELL